MKKIGLICLVVVLVLLTGNSLVLAKSDKGNSGNEGKSHEDSPGKSSNNDRPTNNGVTNNRNGRDIAEHSDSTNSGQSRKNIEKLMERTHEDNDDGFSKHDLKRLKKGAILRLDELEASEGSKPAKLKKLRKVEVREATESAQSKRRAVQGIITNLSGSVMTLAHQIHRDRITQVLIGDAAVIKFKKDKDASSSATLAVGLRVVAIGDLNDSGQLVAKKIIIIPGRAVGIFKKNPLASGSASASAVPSPTLTPTPSASSSASPL